MGEKLEAPDHTEFVMSNLKTLVHCLTAASAWLLAASIAFAQANQPATSGGGSGDSMSYMFPYLIVLLALVLGMLVVARSSSRRERERPAGYVEKKIMDDE
jgi:hypothetical protein